LKKVNMTSQSLLCKKSVVIKFFKMATARSSHRGTLLAFTFITIISCSISPGFAIKCWECNSQYDHRCGEAFDNFTVALVDCDQRSSDVAHIDRENMVRYNAYTVAEAKEIPDTSKATVCRKTTQIVEGKTRVIRGCGWIRNTGEYTKDKSCFTRTGTKEVMVYHCSCKTDGCNTASGRSSLSLATMLLLPLVPAYLLRKSL